MELCKSTKITLLEAKIAVLESVVREYQIKEQLAAETNNIKERFIKLLTGVQKEYPDSTMDNNFNLIPKVTQTEVTQSVNGVENKEL